MILPKKYVPNVPNVPNVPHHQPEWDKPGIFKPPRNDPPRNDPRRRRLPVQTWLSLGEAFNVPSVEIPRFTKALDS
jgi:hypothetical protein